MKITFTVTNDLTYDQRMDRICESLHDAGFEVELIGRKRDFSIPIQRRYKTTRLNCWFTKGKFFYLEFNLRLLFHLLFKKTDVFCAIDLDTLVPNYLISKLRRKPLVYDAHEYFTEVPEVVNRPAIKKMWTGVERWIVPKLKYAYTVGQSIADLFEKEYGVRFEVIRNFTRLENGYQVPSTKYQDRALADEKYIVYAGAVNVGRGLEEIIELMPEIDCKLKVCGDGDILEALKTEVKAKGLEEKIEFTGYLTPDKLRKEIEGAYMGYLVLRNQGLSYYYSLANKFCDYIHAEIPQVTIDFPEYRMLNKGHQVSELVPLEKEEIKKAINRLLSDETLYNERVQQTILAKQELNWQHEAKRLVEFYEKVESTK